jgi:hypothetical protein
MKALRTVVDRLPDGNLGLSANALSHDLLMIEMVAIMRKFAIYIMIVTSIMMIIPIWSLLNDPSIVISHWEFYVPFVVAPYVASIIMLVLARKR